MRVYLVATAFLLAAVPALIGQSPRFEVSSVKVNRSGEPTRLGPTLQASGRVYTVNQPLRLLIRVAYGLEENQVSGGPSWIESEFFDVEARAGADATPEQAREMLRALLTERFALAVHTETRQFPIYELMLDSPNGKTGAQLKPSGNTCAPPALPFGVPPPPPPPPGMSGVPLASTALKLTCPSIFFNGHISLRSIAIDSFAQGLANAVRRPVANRTGLSGTFDIDLRYTPELSGPFPASIGIAGGGPPGAGSGAGADGASASTLPSLPTALREQLGLKLDSSRGPVEVLVIDRVERPTEN